MPPELNHLRRIVSVNINLIASIWGSTGVDGSGLWFVVLSSLTCFSDLLSSSSADCVAEKRLP